MFEVRNPWQRAWAESQFGASAIDYVRPTGAGGESLLLTYGQTGRRSRAWWNDILDAVRRRRRADPDRQLALQLSRAVRSKATSPRAMAPTAAGSASSRCAPTERRRSCRRCSTRRSRGSTRCSPARSPHGVLRPRPDAAARRRLRSAPRRVALIEAARNAGDADGRWPAVEVDPRRGLRHRTPRPPPPRPRPTIRRPVQTWTVQVATPDAAAIDAALASMRGTPGVRGARPAASRSAAPRSCASRSPATWRRSPPRCAAAAGRSTRARARSASRAEARRCRRSPSR